MSQQDPDPGLMGWIPMPAETERIVGTLPLPTLASAEWLKDSGKGKVALLHLAVVKVAGKFPIREQTIGDCFPAGTMVAGEQIQPIERVMVGDTVWTAEGRTTKVVSVREIESHTPIVEINATGLRPIRCTADHRVLVYRMARVRGKRVGPSYYKRAIEGGVRGTDREAVIATFEGRHPEWVRAGDLRDTDMLLTPADMDVMPVPEHSPHGMLASGEGQYLAGFFLGNGHASGGSVELAVSDQAVSDKLVGCLMALGYSPKIGDYRPNCGAWRIRVHNRELVEWCRLAFYGAGGAKVFPGWAVGCAEFIDGLCDADGHGRDGVWNLDSTSESIIDGVMLSMGLLGYEPTCGEVVRSAGTYANAKPLFRVTWRAEKQRQHTWRDEQFIARPVKSIRFIEGPTLVYDIGVADSHHSFIANGVGVHNCVSQGAACAVDVLQCVEIAIKGDRERWVAECATEPIYAGSRVEIGGGKIRGDGSVGAWAADWVRKFGAIPRGKYGNVDLTRYSGERAKEWGRPRGGVPDELEPTIRQHPVKQITQVETYEQARDAIANGFPVTVASNRGFQMARDAQGFARPRGRWGHQMCFVAVDDADKRPGLLCMNSWGPDWINGGTRHDQPPGSFWVDAEVADSMLGQGDSFAFAGYQGFERTDLPDFSQW